MEYQNQVSADPNWPCSGFVEENLLQPVSRKAMGLEPNSKTFPRELAMERYRLRFRAAGFLETQERNSDLTTHLD